MAQVPGVRKVTPSRRIIPEPQEGTDGNACGCLAWGTRRHRLGIAYADPGGRRSLPRRGKGCGRPGSLAGGSGATLGLHWDPAADRRRARCRLLNSRNPSPHGRRSSASPRDDSANGKSSRPRTHPDRQEQRPPRVRAASCAPVPTRHGWTRKGAPDARGARDNSARAPPIRRAAWRTGRDPARGSLPSSTVEMCPDRWTHAGFDHASGWPLLGRRLTHGNGTSAAKTPHRSGLRAGHPRGRRALEVVVAEMMPAVHPPIGVMVPMPRSR